MARAQTILAQEACDFAVLDVNLGSDTSAAVASDLTRAGVPFVFATGYGENADFPGKRADSLVIQKPYDAGALRRILSGMGLA